MPPKIVIVTTTQPSNNPRMVKEYKALKEQGYAVTVLYSYTAEWATQKDELFFNEAGVDASDFILVGGSTEKGKFIYFLSRIIHRLCKVSSRWGLLSDFTISRNTLFLQLAAGKYKADLYIGHNLGALPVVVKTVKNKNKHCGFDLEDYHSGELKDKKSLPYKIASGVEKKFLPQCSYATFSSQAIADEYQLWLKMNKAAVVRNVVEKNTVVPICSLLKPQPLKLVWFSQYIGEERGLETVITAINNLPELDIELHLLGNCTTAYKENLCSQINNVGKLFFNQPIEPNAITTFLKDKHIGLATETGRDDNNNVALSNKLFTYLAAGNMVIATDTLAQKLFVDQYPDVGYCYQKNNADDLAALLAHLYAQPHVIEACRAASLTLAETQLNWDIEKHLLTDIIATVI